MTLSNLHTRVLISGEVDSGKTCSFKTFPGRKVVQFYPGEGGVAALPDDTETLFRVFPVEQKITPDFQPNSQQIILSVRQQTGEILTGKHGEVTTFCGDGIDKLYEYVLDALSGGAYFAGEPVKDAKRGEDALSALVIAQAQHWMFSYLDLILHSRVPYAVFTTWDKDKGDRKAVAGEHWSKIPTRRYPNFYGLIARNILGKFAVKLHASRGRIVDTDTKLRYRWLTKSTTVVACAGIKGDPEMIQRIPTYVPADWGVLEPYLTWRGTAETNTKETA